jgi:anaerobic magnesium-protoporphyrin IX monomethyl ester cyclase
MKKKKILFITPPYHCGVVEVAGRWLPPQFLFLGASARQAGVEPVLYDAMGFWASHDDIIAEMANVNPDYVATSAITATIPDALRVLQNAKNLNPNVVTLLGGVHPTFMDHEILAEHGDTVDYVIRGEGEETLRELLECLEAGGDQKKVYGISFRENGHVARTPPRPLFENLNALGRAWDLIDWTKNYTYYVFPGSRLAAINTSRGCDSECTFCSQQKFWARSWRARSPEDVVEEVQFLHTRLGVDVILLGDEYPTNDRARWEKLLDMLIERRFPIHFLMETRVEDIVRDADIMHKYREAGIVHVYIGVEATNQETLDYIHKDLKVETSKKAIDVLHRHGIVTETSFILGFPEETSESIRCTLELSKWYNPDFAHFLAITPWPYADLYPEVRDYVAVTDYSKYNLIDPIIKPKWMTLEDIDRAMVSCYREFYHGKMKEVLTMGDAFKKDYILTSMKLIMQSSFIVKKMGNLIELPKQMAATMKQLARASGA